MWQYNDGKREAFSTESTVPGLVFALPADYAGNSILVQALGKYEDRQISFSAGYEDTAGLHALGGGTWSVNDAPCTESAAAVSAVLPYVVSYNYSTYANDYYFESTDPECFACDDENAVVTFRQTEVQDANTSYSVRLHPYIRVLITNKKYSGVMGGVGGAVSTLVQCGQRASLCSGADTGAGADAV